MHSFRAIILGEFERRKQKNSRYSLRAYAKKLAVDPTLLGRLIQGKAIPTIAISVRIMTKLDLPLNQRREFFRSLAQCYKDRIDATISSAQRELNQILEAGKKPF